MDKIQQVAITRGEKIEHLLAFEIKSVCLSVGEWVCPLLISYLPGFYLFLYCDVALEFHAKSRKKVKNIWIHRSYMRTIFSSFFFWVLYLFIYLFMAVLGLRFCARAFSSCGEQGPLLIAVRGPPTVAASLVAEHRLQTRRLSNCGS